MKSLKDFLPESFLIELSDGPGDSISPVNGGNSNRNPDPTQTRFGHRELKVGDPVKICNGQFQDEKGKVDDIINDGNSIVVDLVNQGKKSFSVRDVDFDDYGGEDQEEDDYLRSLNNLKQMAGYVK